MSPRIASIDRDERPPLTPATETAASTPGREAASLPDPTPLVRNLTRCIFEIIIGARDIEQVAQWVDPEVLIKMERRLSLERRARGATGRAPISPRVQFGASLIERPADDVVECVTVVHTQTRAKALAMRLVGVGGRWRVTQIALL